MFNQLSLRSASRVAVVMTAGLMLAAGCAGRNTNDNQTAKPAGANDLYARGDKAYQAGDQATAIRDLEAAVAANPKMLMARERLGDAYKDTGRYQDAMAEYRELARLDPYGPTSYYKLGVTQQLLGQLPESAENYQRALKLDSREWRSRMNLGLVRLAQGNTDEAVQSTKMATDAAPNEADAWSNYGVALDAAGKASDAEKAYRKALSLRPKQPGMMVNLAQSLVAQKKYDEAAPLLAEAVQIEDGAFARRLYGDVLKAQGKTAEADAEYSRAAQMK